ncbi:MAG: hypothetical protein H6662_19005, partial [Ardenticatenaceae bacterium]|nr:hypothetical protein [Ardenticatenaceae bacterium]
MPGLVGFYGDIHHDQPRQFLQKMAHALEHENLFRTELHQEGQVGVARVTLGIANAAPQPHWNEAETICVFLEGELYNTQPLRQDLAGRGCQFRAAHDAELILRLYETFGENFAVDLNGNFLIAIYDRKQQKLIVANDRLGLYPLYYARNGRCTLFASGVRALLADPDLPRDVDRAAIAQFLTFDHVLGDRTLLAAARLLPQASLLIMQHGAMTIRPYHTLRYPEQYPLRREQAYVEELQYLLHQAIARQADSDLTAGVLLSGGLDSRQILAVLNDLPANSPLHSFTWGLPGCDDARYAQEIAAMTRAQHHFFPLDPDFLLRTAENSVRITDGMGNIVNLHALATLDEETQHAKVIYKGFLGDAMFGFALRQQFWADYDDATRIHAHLQVHSDQGVITFDPFTEHEQVFAPEFRTAVGDTVLAEYRTGMEASGVHPLATQRLYFDLTQRVPRMTLNGV